MEPERPIEKLIRACASKRREEAGGSLELHPATRKLLQDEVARRFPKKAPEPRSGLGLFIALWPRLAWGVAVLVIIGVLTALLIPEVRQDEPAHMASKRDEPPSASSMAETANATPPPASTPAQPPEADSLQANAQLTLAAESKATEGAITTAATGGVVTNNDSYARELSRHTELGLAPQPTTLSEPAITGEARDAAATANSPGAVWSDARTAPAEARRFATTSSESARKEQSSDQVAPLSAIPAAPTPEPPRLGLAQEREDAGAVLPKRPRPEALVAESTAAKPAAAASASFADRITPRLGVPFTQLQPVAKTKSNLDDQNVEKAGVLTSFHFEQTGRELRIVDRDGSVYTGYINEQPLRARSTTAQRDADQGKAATSSRRLQSAPPAPPQNYTFSVVGTNRTLNQPVVFNGNVLGATNLPLTLSGAQAGDKQLGESISHSRISGRAKIGQRAEMQVEAIPTPTPR